MSLFHLRAKLGRSSVKEAFDNLPSGICFADQNGIIILCNRQMHRLCRDLLGTDLQHLEELRRALKSPQAGVKTVGEGALLFPFPDGKLWQFAESTVTDPDGIQYTQVQAMDVTELQEKRAELEQENRALAEANVRARQFFLELDQIVREKERLDMKMRVHDELGLSLLSTRNLLSRESSLEELRKGGRRWEQVLRMMDIVGSGVGAEYPAPEESLAELIAAAAEIGVQVCVRGELPPSAGNSGLLIAAMRECAVKTARHAGGSRMNVLLTRRGNAVQMEITNNGHKPEGTIVEGGGLSALRRRIESRGGVMTVESRPEFCLTVTLPEKEETK